MNAGGAPAHARLAWCGLVGLRSFAMGCALLWGCTLEAGDRFGRPLVDNTTVRIGVPAAPVSLDPARATTATDRLVARALFAALVEPAGDQLAPSLALGWSLERGNTLRFALDPNASFSDGTPLDAHDVVWSWQRALRTTTRAGDLSPFSVFAQGDALVRGELLRAARETTLSATPYSVFDDDAASSAPAANTVLAAGTSVVVLDSNARRACCGSAVPLLESPDAADAAVTALAVDDVAVVLALRTVGSQRWLRVRGRDGRAGWAPSTALSVVVPRVSMRRLVESGEVPLSLLAGPDIDAPAREALHDDDEVELLEHGPEMSLVMSARSGRGGFVPTAALGEDLAARWWLLVVDAAAPRRRDQAGWAPGDALQFDPGLLPARALGTDTLEVDLRPEAAADLNATLRSFTSAVMRPVAARRVEEHGFEWASVERIVTSGPFLLGSASPMRLVLLRRDPPDDDTPLRITLAFEANRDVALHRIRAGELDALLDGMLAADLTPSIRRYADWMPGPRGGGLAALELKHFHPVDVDLAALRVVPTR